ncbi:MAG TPA: hypothetical protein DCP90_09245 [Clostridiales bacterium]|nr:MAG: hypothetical protein A2Y22_04635 [Clostridiales bacterium GWD2_32_59]HAN10778.1 hypothetical protein [Clostridiales bacterium]
MNNIFKNTFKAGIIILLICAYYLTTLSISAYVISICEKDFFQTLANELNVVNKNAITQVSSNEAEKILNKFTITDISGNVRKVMDKDVNKNTYLFFSTFILIVILLYIKITSSKNKHHPSLSEGKWLGIEDIMLLEERNILSENDGMILGKYQSKNVAHTLTIPKAGMLNKHVIVVDSGELEKTSGFVKTNILNISKDFHSFVISDPKGEYLKDTAGLLREKGYDIKILNLSNIKQSHRWNPLDCVVDGLDAHYMAEIIVEKNHRDNKRETSENIKDTERELLKNMIIYLKQNFDKKSQNMTGIYYMLCTLRTEEIDVLFEQENSLIKMSEFEFYLNQSMETKTVAINNLRDKLEIFDIKILSNMMKVSEIKIEMLKLRPCAYYIILPDIDEKLDLVATLFVSQIIKKIGEIGEDATDDAIKNREVYFMLDEFVRFGYIPKFANRLGRLRAKKINCSIILKSISSLKSVYNDEECTEMMNYSDTKLFYQCNDSQTALYFVLGLAKNLNTSKGKIIAVKDMMNLDAEKCIVAIRGQKPILLYKYDWTNLQVCKVGCYKNNNVILNWIKDRLNNVVRKQISATEYIEPDINIYESENKLAEKKSNITYYNGYKNVPQIKLPNKPDDEYDIETWDDIMSEYDEKAE